MYVVNVEMVEDEDGVTHFANIYGPFTDVNEAWGFANRQGGLECEEGFHVETYVEELLSPVGL